MNKSRNSDGPERLGGSSTMSLFDAPILSPDEDRLGRADFARSMARAVLRMHPTDGFVIALCGPWGSGKTSLLNMVLFYMRHPRLVEDAVSSNDKIIVVPFNPWWFSGKDQLIHQFFLCLRAAIGLRKDAVEALAGIGGLLENFARVLEPLNYVPVISPWMWVKDAVHKVGSYFRGLGDLSKADANKTKQRICEKLRKSPYRILIVIDDIDRLTKTEVRQIFQLVKAVADFPNTIYLLAFHREAVVKMIDEDAGATASDYLEKIVQAPFTVPAADRASLRRMFFDQIQDVIQGTPAVLWDPTEWGNLYWDALDTLIKTPRSIKQFVNTLRPTYAAVIGEVRAADFLGVHAIRVVCPAALEFIAVNKELMVGDRHDMTDDTAHSLDQRRVEFEALLQLVPEENRLAVKNILHRLFPRFAHAYGASHYGSDWQPRWAQERRVCSPEVFDYYFQLSVPPGAVSTREFNAIINAAVDTATFLGELRRLRRELQPDGKPRLRAFLERLENLPDEVFHNAGIASFVAAVLEAGDELFDPLESAGMLALDLGDDWFLQRCVLRALKHLPSQESRESVLKDAIDGGRSVSLMVDIFDTLAYEQKESEGTQDAGAPPHHIVSREGLRQIQLAVTGKVEDAATDGSLLDTPKLPHVLGFWKSTDSLEKVAAKLAPVLAEDLKFARLLSRFLSAAHSHSIDDRVARRAWRVDVPSIEALTGTDQERLATRCESILEARFEWMDERMRIAMDTLVSEVRDPRDELGRPRRTKRSDA